MTDAAATKKAPTVDPVDRLRRISRAFATATAAAMVLVTLGIAGAWLVPMLTGTTLVPRSGSFKEFFDDPAARAAAFAIIVGLLGLLLFALEQARQLFREFADGEILTLRAAVRLRRVAYAVVAGSIAKPLAQAALTAAFEPGRGDEAYGCARRASSLLLVPLRDVVSDLAFLLAGLLLLAIAWALAEAARIAADHRPSNAAQQDANAESSAGSNELPHPARQRRGAHVRRTRRLADGERIRCRGRGGQRLAEGGEQGQQERLAIQGDRP